MADKTYDAVIIGGGNKALLLAMYLIKYGGMTVGIFERRHEIGGCLATEEISAPGFRGNTHANIILPWYYLPVWRDFPEFWEYGAQWDQYLCSDGFVFRDNETCLAIYSDKHDPSQARTEREIARFSEKDAKKWRKICNLEQSDEYQNVQMDMLFLPAEMRMAPEVMQRQMEVFPKLIEADMEPDGMILSASPYRAAREWFESQELQSCLLRFAVTGAFDINEPGNGVMVLGMATSLSTIGFNRGGTHMIAHAAHQVLNHLGCEFHINKEVEKVIIENATAKGIRLNDGTEIGARKLIVSTLNPNQLVFDLIGREHVEDKLARRVELLENVFGCIMWYSFAVHEKPRYRAGAFNPDINETEWLGLQPDPDPIHIARECRHAKLLQWPPPKDDYCPTVWCNSMVDPSYAPEGKHVLQNEQLGPPASMFSEKQWLEIGEQYARDLVDLWKDYAPNMTWDNIIGVDMNTPYDHNRMSNLLPNGTMAGIDRPPHQINENRPTPELANHRTPIKNLYATGGCWHVGTNAGSSESYNCYKIIAKDMNLGKPWEEPGKEEPYSLVEKLKTVRKKVQDTVRKD